MPRRPEVASALAGITDSLFSAVADRLRTFEGEIYPLHVGDTFMEPAAGCRMQDLKITDYPGMHRYAAPHGTPDLLAALGDRVEGRTGISTEPDEILITAGATGALGAIAGAVLDPGDEVLLMAPYWPLISGIVRSFRGIPIEVPIIEQIDDPYHAIETLQRHLGERAVALYLNTPNNPTGRVLSTATVEAIVDFCRANNLWILADEVYEDYVYEGIHTYCRTLAAERTFSVHSFSKAYGMAGNRCGYVVGPGHFMTEIRKVGAHTFYSAPTGSQIAALRALQGHADEWLETAQGLYRQLGAESADRLGVDTPEGSTFLFLNIEEQLDDRGMVGFLDDCADRGLFLAPGDSFGPYPTHVRVCFTSAAPEIVRRGVDLLARMLGR